MVSAHFFSKRQGLEKQPLWSKLYFIVVLKLHNDYKITYVHVTSSYPNIFLSE